MFIRCRVGNEVIETGKRIQLLDAEDRSHIVVPVVYALRANVPRSSRRRSPPDNDDVYYLVERQRQPTRPLILNAPTRLRRYAWSLAAKCATPREKGGLSS